MKKLHKPVLALAVILVLAAAFTFTSSAETWVSAWGTGPTKIGVDGYQNITAYVGDVTARTIITPSASGSMLRIKVSNLYGDEPLVLTSATVAKSLGGSKIDTETAKMITFNKGYKGVTVPAGEEIYSDPVYFDVTANSDKIAISFYAEKFTEIKTMGLSGADTYLTFGGDQTHAETFGLASVMDNEQVLQIISKLLGSEIDLQLAYSFIKVVPCVVSLDVCSPTDNAYSVVVIGDSTVSNEFPQYLSEKIVEAGFTNVGVVGKGIIGNSLLSDGLGFGSQLYGKSLISRFDADVLAATGVKYVIIKIGANDIIHPVCIDMATDGVTQPTAKQIIAGYQQLFRKCHDAGIKVVTMSITQWKGTTRNYFGSSDSYVRTDEEFQKDWKIAEDVNKWLKTTTESDGHYDVVDMSANPKDPDAFLPEYTIDGIHPSDTLQRVWAENFPLSLIGIGKSVNKVTLSSSSFSLNVGKTKTLKATVLPTTAEDKTVKWYSSNTKVATVDSNGKVKAVANGTATIICKTNDGGITATCTVKVVTPVSSVSLSKTSVSIYTTKSATLSATVLPETATDKSVTWTSSNTKVATVSSKGKVTAVGAGTATITCTSSNGIAATCTVKVLKKTEVTSISLNKTSFNIYKGKTYTLKATVNPSDATFRDVEWTTSNKKIATVDSNGKVTAKKAGTVTITCTSVDNPMAKKTCKVTVKVKTTGVELNAASVKKYQYKTYQLKATVLPSDATNKKVTWTSSNTKVATVDSNGKVTFKKAGTAYITCTTNNSGCTAKCKIVVIDAIEAKSIKLNKTKLSLVDGDTYTLQVTTNPTDATYQTFKWSSSDTKIAKVNSKGKITAVNPGTATIICTTKDTGKTAKCVVTVKEATPTKVTLNKTKVTVGYNATYQLKATVSPSNASNKKVTWKSSDPSIVYVNSKGVVQGMTPGKSAVITCTTVEGKKVAKCTVTVGTVKVTGVKLNNSSVTLSGAQTYTLKATVSPSNAGNKSVTWTSSNTKVVKVSSNGVLTPVSTGTATITCKTKDGGYTAKCTVQVKTVKVLGVTLNQTSLRLNNGASVTLKATVVPSDATNKAVTWKSSDTSVATVKNGKVTAVGAGTCEVKVYTSDGNYVALCKVTVV